MPQKILYGKRRIKMLNAQNQSNEKNINTNLDCVEEKIFYETNNSKSKKVSYMDLNLEGFETQILSREMEEQLKEALELDEVSKEISELSELMRRDSYTLETKVTKCSSGLMSTTVCIEVEVLASIQSPHSEE